MQNVKVKEEEKKHKTPKKTKAVKWNAKLNLKTASNAELKV